jgi:hypothetical protein
LRTTLQSLDGDRPVRRRKESTQQGGLVSGDEQRPTTPLMRPYPFRPSRQVPSKPKFTQDYNLAVTPQRTSKMGRLLSLLLASLPALSSLGSHAYLLAFLAQFPPLTPGGRERGGDDSPSQESVIRETRHENTVRELGHARAHEEEQEAVDELDLLRRCPFVGGDEGVEGGGKAGAARSRGGRLGFELGLGTDGEEGRLG